MGEKSTLLEHAIKSARRNNPLWNMDSEDRHRWLMIIKEGAVQEAGTIHPVTYVPNLLNGGIDWRVSGKTGVTLLLYNKPTFITPDWWPLVAIVGPHHHPRPSLALTAECLVLSGLCARWDLNPLSGGISGEVERKRKKGGLENECFLRNSKVRFSEYKKEIVIRRQKNSIESKERERPLVLQLCEEESPRPSSEPYLVLRENTADVRT